VRGKRGASDDVGSPRSGQAQRHTLAFPTAIVRPGVVLQKHWKILTNKITA